MINDIREQIRYLGGRWWAIKTYGGVWVREPLVHVKYVLRGVYRLKWRDINLILCELRRTPTPWSDLRKQKYMW